MDKKTIGILVAVGIGGFLYAYYMRHTQTTIADLTPAEKTQGVIGLSVGVAAFGFLAYSKFISKTI
jgi:uncharacterized membrane protein required for colicin V production